MQNDSVKKTVLVAFLLCVVCSVLVSTAAVVLKPNQERNKMLDIKKNLLLATGLIKSSKTSAEEINRTFEQVETVLIDLESGEKVDDVPVDTFDAYKEAKGAKYGLRIPGELDIAGIKYRSKLSKIYLIKDSSGEVTQIVLPVHGKGLWSTMYGFLALAPDTKTVEGLGFYAHGETPGLGGEIENPNWIRSWKDKVVMDEDFNPHLLVIKGMVGSDTPERERKIDGLSGATLTSVGVQHMVNYWLGEHGYAEVLKNIRANGGSL